MRRTIEHPVYRMSLPDLSLLGDKAVYLIDRDTAILSNYGVNAATVTFLQDTNTHLMAIPSDEVLKGYVGEAVEKRNVTGDAIKVAIRDIMLRPKLAYGENTAKYRSFGTTGMDKMDPVHLHYCAETVVLVSETRFDDLESFGLTHDIIDALNDQAIKYKKEIFEKDKAVSERNVATELRITTGNLLYKKIVQIFEIGKTYWFDKSEAKYNDYVIYNTPDQKKPEPGQYGSAHGSALRSDNNECPDNALVFIEGVEVPIIPDENGNWEMDTVPVGKRKISATGVDCKDFESEIEILPDDDVEFDILMEPADNTPPA